MTNYPTLSKKTLLSALLLSTALVTAVTNATTLNADYAVSAYGKDAGDATITFQLPLEEAAGSTAIDYSASLTYSPSTLASLFGGEAYHETTNGLFHNGLYSPSQHRQTLSGSGKEIKTDFSEHVIYYQEESETREFSVENSIYDTLSLILQVREDAKNDKVKPNYYWISGDNIRNYNAEFNKTDEISKIVLTQANSSKRVITIEFDKDYNLLLFHKVKSGDVQFSLTKTK